MAAPERHVVITCEHGGHRVPPRYRSLFKGHARLLRSHRGWDAGALLVAGGLARGLGVPLLGATTTRLLVDLNRSPDNSRVLSELTRGLPREARESLLALHHQPHWNRVRAAIALADSPTVHLAVHSFTPVWNGRPRPFPIGILYDPKRVRERRFARRWRERLAEELAPFRIRLNAPYRGDADGLTTAMRREHAASRYLGLELELNQASLADPSRRRRLTAIVLASLREALEASVP